VNKDNIDALWDVITPKLYGYLVNTLHDKSLAEDILQTSWLKALETLPRFKDRGAGISRSFSSWLFAIARNECKQHWRKGGREVPFDPLIHDKQETDSGDEDRIMVDQILAHLSADDRELIRLRYIADLTMNDIAKVLNINPIAVRVRMHRAMRNAKIILHNQSNT
jgi:RNA polymerase sigma factor (sigma-70 family)